MPANRQKRVDLDTLTAEQVQNWKPGERLLLNGKLLTGRDAAHKRIQELLDSGQGLPPGVDFTNRLIYYVGPSTRCATRPSARQPPTATRMDKFTEMMLSQDRPDRHGQQGRAETGRDRGRSKHKAAYLMAVGGAAYLVSQGDPLGQGHRVRGAGHGGDYESKSWI